MNSAAVRKAMPKAVRKDLSSHLNEARTSLRTIETKFIEATRHQTANTFQRHFEQCFASALSQFEQTLARLIRGDGETLLAWIGSEVTPDHARFVEALIENNGEKLINAARRRAPRMLIGACEGIPFEKHDLLDQISGRSIPWLPEQASSDLAHHQDYSLEEPPAFSLKPQIDERTLVVTMELKIADMLRVVLKREQASMVTRVHLTVEGTSAATARDSGGLKDGGQESIRDESQSVDERGQDKPPRGLKKSDKHVDHRYAFSGMKKLQDPKQCPVMKAKEVMAVLGLSKSAVYAHPTLERINTGKRSVTFKTESVLALMNSSSE